MAADWTRKRISEHIWYKEVLCPCGCIDKDNPFLYVDPGVIALFEIWRTFVGHPLPITSFYRCEKHNKAIGGAVNSFHRLGAAIDFIDSQSELTASYLSRLSTVVGAGGLGIYLDEGHFHIDCGHLYGFTPTRRWRGREGG